MDVCQLQALILFPAYPPLFQTICVCDRPTGERSSGGGGGVREEKLLVSPVDVHV